MCSFMLELITLIHTTFSSGTNTFNQFNYENDVSKLNFKCKSIISTKDSKLLKTLNLMKNKDRIINVQEVVIEKNEYNRLFTQTENISEILKTLCSSDYYVEQLPRGFWGINTKTLNLKGIVNELCTKPAQEYLINILCNDKSMSFDVRINFGLDKSNKIRKLNFIIGPKEEEPANLENCLVVICLKIYDEKQNVVSVFHGKPISFEPTKSAQAEATSTNIPSISDDTTKQPSFLNNIISIILSYRMVILIILVIVFCAVFIYHQFLKVSKYENDEFN